MMFTKSIIFPNSISCVLLLLLVWTFCRWVHKCTSSKTLRINFWIIECQHLIIALQKVPIHCETNSLTFRQYIKTFSIQHLDGVLSWGKRSGTPLEGLSILLLVSGTLIRALMSIWHYHTSGYVCQHTSTILYIVNGFCCLWVVSRSAEKKHSLHCVTIALGLVNVLTEIDTFIHEHQPICSAFHGKYCCHLT